MKRLGLLTALLCTGACADPGDSGVFLTNERVRQLAGVHRETHRTAPAPRAVLQAARPRAVDGDTFRSAGVRYRVRGIDTPERGQPRYLEAKLRLQQLLDSGEISIERRARDAYGRTVAVVRVNGQDVAATLKAEGYEKPAAYRTRRPREAWL